jgi:hypothetical protein
MTDQLKGRVTFRIAAVLFALSALFELLVVLSPVPLFGVVAGGAVAVVYHLVYVALFVVLAAGRWGGRRYGYYAVYAATALYTVDRVQLVGARAALAELVRAQLVGQEELLRAVGMDYVMQVLTVLILVMVAGWWGFAAYVYFRRAYFGIVAATR